MDLIEFNLLVPVKDVPEIIARKSPDFIIESSVSRAGADMAKTYFHLRASEEELSFYTLKYGSRSAWKR